MASATASENHGNGNVNKNWSNMSESSSETSRSGSPDHTMGMNQGWDCSTPGKITASYAASLSKLSQRATEEYLSQSSEDHGPSKHKQAPGTLDPLIPKQNGHKADEMQWEKPFSDSNVLKGGPMQRAGAASGKKRANPKHSSYPSSDVSPKQFGLARWKEYAVARHGTSPKFASSAHGSAILAEEAKKQEKSALEKARARVEYLEATNARLEKDLQSERETRAQMTLKLEHLQKEVDKLSARKFSEAPSSGKGRQLQFDIQWRKASLHSYLHGTPRLSDPNPQRENEKSKSNRRHTIDGISLEQVEQLQMELKQHRRKLKHLDNELNKKTQEIEELVKDNMEIKKHHGELQQIRAEEQKKASKEIERLNAELAQRSRSNDASPSKSLQESPEAFGLSPEAHSFDMSVKKSHRRVTSRDDIERMYGSLFDPRNNTALADPDLLISSDEEKPDALLKTEAKKENCRMKQEVQKIKLRRRHHDCSTEYSI